MALRCLATSCVIVLLLGLDALGQNVSVQQPTFSQFSTGTTVSVPDRGSAHLGGINRAESGRSEFGVPMLPFRPFRNQAYGQSRSASSVRASVTIHDFEAMDEALLGTPSSGVSTQRSGSSPAAGNLAGHALQPRKPNLAGQWTPAARQDDSPAMNLADERARRLDEQKTKAEEAEEFFARGQQAEVNGRPGAAKIFYQMAARRASGELKEQSMARLQALSSSTTKLAQGQP